MKNSDFFKLMSVLILALIGAVMLTSCNPPTPKNGELPVKKEYILTKNSYYPYFTHDETQGGWVFYISGNYCYCYSYAAAAYFKTKKEAINFGKKFIHLYKEILPKF